MYVIHYSKDVYIPQVHLSVLVFIEALETEKKIQMFRNNNIKRNRTCSNIDRKKIVKEKGNKTANATETNRQSLSQELAKLMSFECVSTPCPHSAGDQKSN